MVVIIPPAPQLVLGTHARTAQHQVSLLMLSGVRTVMAQHG